MRLTQLKPTFIRYEMRIVTWQEIDGPYETWKERGCPSHPVTAPREHEIVTDSFAEAQGIRFLCPLCFQNNGNSDVGTHWCSITFADRGVPDDMGTHNLEGKAVRWNVSGSNFEDLTTTPSILLQGGCNWHGYITLGEVSI